MPIEMPRGLPFSVDTWTPISNRKRRHFLTHAHKDHLSGILSHSSFPIYCTSFTKFLLLHFHPQLEKSLFVDIEIGQSVAIDDPDGNFTVTAFDANHCPGAVMFLFEGNFGNILHTGDCRLTAECLQCLPEKYMSKNGKEPRCRLDCVFLDCTFGSFHQTLPSKHSAIQQVINCIWKHPAAAVIYLTCDLLGQEDILAEVSRTFGAKIYVDKAANPECFKTLAMTAPQILCQDPSSRFHLFSGFPKLRQRAAAKFAEAKANFKPEPLIIRASAQWYACEGDDVNAEESQNKRKYDEAVRDDFGIWHVCYSIHSSREELEWALRLLMPKWVVSTTPSCRAIELDYVTKLSSSSQLMKDSPIWKLLSMSFEASTEDEGSSRISTVFQQQPVNLSNSSKLSSLSPPSKRQTVTLFGKARLCNSGSKHKTALLESCLKIAGKIDNGVTVEVKSENRLDNKESDSVCTEHRETSMEKETEKEESCVENAGKIDQEVIVEAKSESRLETEEAISVCTEHSEKSSEKETEKAAVCSSRKLSESLRKLYRTMNVHVPRPLPSLLELHRYNKQNKRRIQFLY